MTTDQLSNDLASLRIDRSAPPPSRFPWGCVLAVLALGAAAWYGYEKVSPSLFKLEVATTQVIVVSPAQASTELTALGYVVAQRQSKVACQLLSRISDMRVREGQVVKAGEVLFRVEDAAQRAQLSAAKARSHAAKARALAAAAALAERKQQFARESSLVPLNAVPASTAEDRREQVRAQDASLRAAEQEAAAADEEVRATEVQLEYTTVRAPFDGVVLGKPLDVGELVGTVTEKPAVELCDPETLLAEIDVPEKRLEKIRIKGPAEVVLEAYPDNRYRAEVVEVGSRVDRSKGTVVVKLRLLEKPERLLPDMRARAGFLNEALDAKAVKEPPKTVLPRSAVAERAGATVVFVVDAGRARMQTVQLGPEFGGGYELRSGPEPGTVLVSEPPPTLVDGQLVKEKSK